MRYPNRETRKQLHMVPRCPDRDWLGVRVGWGFSSWYRLEITASENAMAGKTLASDKKKKE